MRRPLSPLLRWKTLLPPLLPLPLPLPLSLPPPLPLPLLLLLLSPLGSVTAAAPTELECPLPAGPGSASPATCRRYSACQWTEEAGCRLTDRVGYRVVRGAVTDRVGYRVTRGAVRGAVRGRRSSSRHLLLAKRTDATLFGGDVQRLALTVTEHDRHRLRLVFRDSEKPRYEVPLTLDLPTPPHHRPPRPEYRVHLPTSAEGRPGDAGPPFSLSVQQGRRTSLRLLPQLTYSDQFIETTLLLAARDVYGMGENNHDSFRHDLDAAETWPVFARGQPPGDGREPLYGAHPFLVAIEDASGQSLGVMFLNSNAMEYKVFRLNGTAAVTFRTTGGVLDLCLFFGRSPLEVLRQYHLTIGLPALPAYWALGFQLSRFGYRSADEVRRTVARTRAAGVPLDVQYVDVDYMDGRRDFTAGKDKFGDLARLVADLRQQDVHVALIYDPALAADVGRYPSVDRGVTADVFVRWRNSSLVPADQCTGCRDYVVGYMWTRNRTLLADFFQQATVDWWADEMRRFSTLAGGPDGFWIDMNEPTNYGTNLEKPFNWPSDLPPWSLKCPKNALDDPPYPTAHARDPSNKSKRLSDETICMTSKHINDIFPIPFPRRQYNHSETGDQLSTYRRLDNSKLPSKHSRQELLHYDVHSLYGWSQMHATRRAMDAVLGGRRGLLLSRSTFPGSGRWGAHWTGDNTARWKDMKRSVVRMLEFSMFGLPHVGSDICGFNGNTTEELCLRWTQLGAFYPFCRNHNGWGAAAQDPTVWPSVAAAARHALGLRYRLLPHLYTLLYRAAAFGAAVVRPLAFEFPTRPELRGVDTQFLWGGDVMVVPVLDEQHPTFVEVVFPPGEWYDLRNGSLAHAGDVTAMMPYHVPLTSMIPVFARAGVILPQQPNASSTAESRRGAFTLAVFGRRARGELFWDDGESSDTLAADRFYHCFFQFAGGALRVLVDSAQTQWLETPLLERLVFHGVTRPASVTADGSRLPDGQVRYDDGMLTVSVQLHVGVNHLVQLNARESEGSPG